MAKVISYLLHPLMVPLYLFLSIVTLDPYLLPQLIVRIDIIVLLVVDIIAPGISLYLMYRKGLLSDLEISDVRQRFTPYMLVLGYYVMTYAVLRYGDLPIPPEIFTMFMALILSLALGLLISFYWKISVHMLAMGGAWGVIAALSFMRPVDFLALLMLITLLAGLLGWARMKLNMHSLQEVYGGFVLSAIIHIVIITNGYYL